MTKKLNIPIIYAATPGVAANSENAIELPSTLVNAKSVVVSYTLRMVSLAVIKQVMHLSRDVQKHRGLGMALLAGNKEYAVRFEKLQHYISQRIGILNAFNTEEKSIASILNMKKINESWSTVKEGWHDDSVLENFQFHSYFVEQLLHIAHDLSQNLQSTHLLQPFSQTVVPSYQGIKNQGSLLTFITYQLPNMIECLGMVRALATHSATVGHQIAEYDKKLKYLCQCVITEKLLTIAASEQLHDVIGADIPSLLTLKTYEYKLDVFIKKVSQQVVGNESITFSSDEVFTMATEIIDVYWRVVDDGIDLLRCTQDEFLEIFCSNNVTK